MTIKTKSQDYGKTADYLSHILCAIKVILLALCFGHYSAFAEEDLLSLSLKELMSIPVHKTYKGVGIYQSKSNPIGDNTHNFGLVFAASPNPQYAAEITASVDLAAELVNKQGGINGHPLAIVKADDSTGIQMPVSLTKRLVDEYRVTSIIGPGYSDSAEALLKQVSFKQHIPIISHAASSNKLSDIAGGQYFWRMVMHNGGQAKTIVDNLVSLNRHKKVIIISGRDLYSNEMTQAIKERLKEAEGHVIDQLKISALVDMNTLSLREEFSAIRRQRPSAIIVTVKAKIVRQVLDHLTQTWRGELPYIVTGDTFKPTQYPYKKPEKVLSCVHFLISDDPTEASKALQEKINALLDVKENITGYDSAYVFDSVILFAMARTLEVQLGIPFQQGISKVTDGDYPITPQNFAELVNLVKQHKNLAYYGVSGRIDFDELGNNIYAKMQIRNAKKEPNQHQSCEKALP